MAEPATSTTYTYCGEPEPTLHCELYGFCDYHLGAMPGGPSPWDLGQVAPFNPPARRGPRNFDELKAQEAEREGSAPFDDGGRQPCGCSPEFHSARCPR